MPGKVAVVLGEVHKDEVQTMLGVAKATAEGLGISIVDEVWVPGSHFRTALSFARNFPR